MKGKLYSIPTKEDLTRAIEASVGHIHILEREIENAKEEILRHQRRITICNEVMQKGLYAGAWRDKAPASRTRPRFHLVR